MADFYCAEDVMRFTGKQVEAETDWVLAQIDQALGSASHAPHPPAPSPRVRGEGEQRVFLTTLNSIH